MRIFLVGFMGSGKSYWGKLWARANEMSFYDIDDIIEQAEQKSILDIFEQKGEDHFRFTETMILHTMIAHENCIIACGGGTACFNENMEWMNEHGVTIYLSATPAKLLENIMKEKDKRPLFKNVHEDEMVYFIEQRLKQRLVFYHQAKLTLHIEDLDIDSLKNKVISPY